jgi:hypothetical protein
MISGGTITVTRLSGRSSQARVPSVQSSASPMLTSGSNTAAGWRNTSNRNPAARMASAGIMNSSWRSNARVVADLMMGVPVIEILAVPASSPAIARISPSRFFSRN